MYSFSGLTKFLDECPARGFPAVDVSIAKDGKEIYRHAAGFSDGAKKTPVSPDDLYYFFSISKITTCIAAMRLVERGIIALDDPVSKYLPAYKDLFVKQGNAIARAQNVMTVRHLFAMTGGVDYDIGKVISAFGTEKAATVGTVEFVSKLAAFPLDFEPGTKYAYSLCHDILAAVVEVASGERFADYVRKNIFDPLGMKDTTYHFDPAKTEKKLTAMYRAIPCGRRVKEIPCENGYYIVNPNYDSGGAGLCGTAGDQSKLLAAVANDGRSKDGYQLLKPETVKLLTVGQLCDSAQETFHRDRLYGYSWGLCGRVHLDPLLSGSKAPVGEFGWDGAAAAYGLMDPINRVSLFFATEVMGCAYAYNYIHPTIKELMYEGLEG